MTNREVVHRSHLLNTSHRGCSVNIPIYNEIEKNKEIILLKFLEDNRILQ